jgi:hypothetical protein
MGLLPPTFSPTTGPLSGCVINADVIREVGRRGEEEVEERGGRGGRGGKGGRRGEERRGGRGGRELEMTSD